MGLKSLAKHFNFVVCNPCKSSPSLTILVPLWFIMMMVVVVHGDDDDDDDDIDNDNPFPSEKGNLPIPLNAVRSAAISKRKLLFWERITCSCDLKELIHGSLSYFERIKKYLELKET